MSLGEVTAATLYVQMLIDPVDRVVAILDELQMGAASLARLLGVAQVPDDREVSGAVPRDEKLDATDVRFSYVDGRDVLHGVDLDVGVGERIAMVGPSGAGKSTLGRLLAGIHPPRTGAVTVGGVGLVELPLDDLRGHVALVTQEHHVFVGTIRENLALAIPPGGDSGDEAIRAALDAVDALVWVRAPARGPGHGRRLGRSHPHRRPRPSRWRWPGWCSPTRTPWCSTRRPPSSTRARPGTSSGRWPWSSRVAP